MINQLNFCFECSYRCQLPRPLSKSIIKIHQTNQKLNPLWSRIIDQAIDQRFKEKAYDPQGHDYFTK